MASELPQRRGSTLTSMSGMGSVRSERSGSVAGMQLLPQARRQSVLSAPEPAPAKQEDLKMKVSLKDSSGTGEMKMKLDVAIKFSVVEKARTLRQVNGKLVHHKGNVPELSSAKPADARIAAAMAQARLVGWEEAHLEGLKRVFDSFDKNGDGTVEVAEFVEGVERLGLSDELGSMGGFFTVAAALEMDYDGSGTVTLDEVITGLSKSVGSMDGEADSGEKSRDRERARLLSMQSSPKDITAALETNAQANILYLQGRYDEALALYNKAIGLFPNNFSIFRNRQKCIAHIPALNKYVRRVHINDLKRVLRNFREAMTVSDCKSLLRRLKFIDKPPPFLIRVFDNGSGIIDQRELCAGLGILSKATPEERIRFLFEVFDSNRDGGMTKPEFSKFMETYINGVCKGVYAILTLPPTHVATPREERERRMMNIESVDNVSRMLEDQRRRERESKGLDTTFMTPMSSEGGVELRARLDAGEPSPAKSAPTRLEERRGSEPVDDQVFDLINSLSTETYARRINLQNKRDKFRKLKEIKHLVTRTDKEINVKLQQAADRVAKMKQTMLDPHERAGLREKIPGLFLEAKKPIPKDQAYEEQLEDQRRQEVGGDAYPVAAKKVQGSRRRSSLFSVRDLQKARRSGSTFKRRRSTKVGRSGTNASGAGNDDRGLGDIAGLGEENGESEESEEEYDEDGNVIKKMPRYKMTEKRRKELVEKATRYVAEQRQKAQKLGEGGIAAQRTWALSGRLERLDKDLRGLGDPELLENFIEELRVGTTERELEASKRFRTAGRKALAMLAFQRRQSYRRRSSQKSVEDLPKKLMQQITVSRRKEIIEEIERLRRILDLTDGEVEELKEARGLSHGLEEEMNQLDEEMSKEERTRVRADRSTLYPSPIRREGSLSVHTEKTQDMISNHISVKNEFQMDSPDFGAEDPGLLGQSPSYISEDDSRSVSVSVVEENSVASSERGSRRGSFSRESALPPAAEGGKNPAARRGLASNLEQAFAEISSAAVSGQASADTDGKGEAGFASALGDFISANTKVVKVRARETIDKLFNKLDINGDGKLSFDEFYRFLNRDKVWKQFHRSIEKEFLSSSVADGLSVEQLVFGRLGMEREAKKEPATEGKEMPAPGKGFVTQPFFLTQGGEPDGLSSPDLTGVDPTPAESDAESEGIGPLEESALPAGEALESESSLGTLDGMLDNDLIARPKTSKMLSLLRANVLKVRPDDDATRSKRFVQQVKFDLFQEEVPFELDGEVILQSVSDALRASNVPVPSVVYEALATVEMEELFSCLFWYVFCRFYQKHSRGEQGVMMQAMTKTYEGITAMVSEKHLPRFTEYIAYTLSVAVIQQFHAAFHGSRPLFTSAWAKQVHKFILEVFRSKEYDDVKRHVLFPLIRVPRRGSEPVVKEDKGKSSQRRLVFFGNVYNGEVSERGHKHGYGKCHYLKQGVYEGEWREDARHGVGKHVYPNDGGTYNGNWAYDKREGRGTLRLSNGDVYDGIWSDDVLKKGKGRMTTTTGEVYTGTFFNGKRSGQGECHYANRDVYRGEFLGDLRHGRGKMNYHNGDTFEGKWENDMWKHGKGHVKYQNGEDYIGEFVGYQRDGQGRVTCRNGDNFDGRWLQDKWEEGTGTFTFGNGDKYSGEFSGNRGKKNFNVPKRHGAGFQQWANGDVYDGEWKRDRRHGRGKFRCVAEASEYDGEWRKGLMCGSGTMRYHNMDKYVGSWFNNKRHGLGTIYEFDKKTGQYTKWQGVWTNGIRVPEDQSGNSIIPHEVEVIK